MLRFKLGQLALAMVVIGVALAALTRASPPWVSVIYTASVAGFGLATIGGLFARRRHRPFYAGAALAVLLYVVAARSFPAPLELVPAWAIRTWAQGGLTTTTVFVGTYPSTSYTITTQATTTSPTPFSSATAQALVDSYTTGATATTPAPLPAPGPAAVPYPVASSPGPATLQQTSAPQANGSDLTWIYTSPISPTTAPTWSRANAGLIAEMEAVWLVALAGGWLARWFARRADADRVDGQPDSATTGATSP